MGNGISPGRDGLGLEGLFAPRRRHFLADDAVEILFYWYDVDDGQAPAARRFHHFQGAAVGIAVGNLNGPALDQGPDLDGHSADIAIDSQVRPGQGNGDRYVGSGFLPEHVAAVDAQPLRPGDGHPAPSFADADAQSRAVLDGLLMRICGLFRRIHGLFMGRRCRLSRMSRCLLGISYGWMSMYCFFRFR